MALTGITNAVTPLPSRPNLFYDAVGDFGFVGDFQRTLGTTSVTGTSLTDTTNPFTPRDVGKRITIPFAGSGTSPNTAMLTTTIAAYVNAGSVTLTTGATTSVSSSSCSWGTDNSAAEALMVSTINNASFAGATIFFEKSPTNAYGVQTTWTFNKPCQIVGIGGGYTADSGVYATLGGTCLAWWGTSSDGGTNFQAMITFVPTGVQNLKRVAFRHIWLDCFNCGQNQALYGLKLVSCPGHILEDFFVRDALAQAVWLDINSVPTESNSTARFSHRDVAYRQLDNTSTATTTPTTTSSALTWSTSGQSMTIAAANNLRTAGYVWVMSNLGYPVLIHYTGGGGTTTLTGCTCATEDTTNAPASYSGANVVEATPGNGGAYKFNGTSTGDTNLGVIDMAVINHGTTWGPAAVEFQNGDSMVLRQIVINGGSNTTLSGSNRQQKPGIRFNGSNTAQTLAARNNIVYDGDPGSGGGGVSAMAVLNTGSTMSYPSGPNKWYNYQLGNGSPLPTIEAGAQLVWSGNGMVNTGEHYPATLTTTTVASASTAVVAKIPLPIQGIQVGLTVRCVFTLSKTAAGSSTRITGVKIGTTGTGSDTTINSVSRTPTAAADTGYEEILFAITGPLGASCTSVMTSQLTKATTGSAAGLFATAAAVSLIVGTPVSFNSTTYTSGSQVWLSFFVTTGTSEVLTISPPVICEVLKGANP
jgi:hypothetical protein